MPYKEEWVSPDIFISVMGVTIFHTYNNDDYNNASGYVFSTSSEENEEREEKYDFDIRDIDPRIKSVANQTEFMALAESAIAAGLISGKIVVHEENDGFPFGKKTWKVEVAETVTKVKTYERSGYTESEAMENAVRQAKLDGFDDVEDGTVEYTPMILEDDEDFGE